MFVHFASLENVFVLGGLVVGFGGGFFAFDSALKSKKNLCFSPNGLQQSVSRYLLLTSPSSRPRDTDSP